MLVSFVCNRAEELYPMLECSISGNYGHIRLSPEEYRKKEATGQLTDQERQEFNEPGPFSIIQKEIGSGGTCCSVKDPINQGT